MGLLLCWACLGLGDQRRAEAASAQDIQLVGLLRDLVRKRKLPFTAGGSLARSGVNLADGSRGEPPPELRNWRRNASSLSVARHMQHAAMWRFVDEYSSRLRGHARCLDWDGWYVGSVFASVCAEKDVIEYAAPPHRQTKPKRLMWVAPGVNPIASHWYLADAHSMSKVIPHAAYDLVIANSVFEHLHQPFVAMQEVFKILRPGGFVFWHTPFEYEYHGVPFDFFRYTAKGARAVAEDAGLVVELAEGDGGYAAVLSNLLGLGSHHWTDEDLSRDENKKGPTLHYLATRMIARKPKKVPRWRGFPGGLGRKIMPPTSGARGSGARGSVWPNEPLDHD